jgi:hypothetical protein
MFFAEHAQTTEVPEAFAVPEALTEPELFSDSQSSEEPDMPAEPQMSAEPEMSASPADAGVAEAESAPALLADETEELDVPEISESPALLFANEPAPDAQEPESFQEQEADSHAQHAPVWDGDPVAASIVAHAGDVAPVEASGESQTAEPVAGDDSSAAVAAVTSSHAASPESGQATSASSASSLSPEMLDEVVRRVVAHMSEQVVREIAWEVVPDLAERLIRQRLEEERTRTE